MKKYSISRLELPTIFEMKTVNSFLVLGDSVTVVDCGENTDNTWNAMETGLKEHGLGIKDIDEIVITHAHVDHMGMARRLSDESNAKVHVSNLVHNWAVDLDTEWDARTAVMEEVFSGLITPQQKENFFGMLKAFFGKVGQYWQDLSEDQIEVFDAHDHVYLGGHKFQSIHAPGHSHSQTCFYNPDNCDLITADMLLRITPTCVVERNPVTGKGRNRAMPELLNSYQKFRDMEVRNMFPGHYIITEDHRALIDRQVERINMRKDQVYSLISNGKSNFLDIFLALYEGNTNFPGLVMTIGYLDLLEDEGRIKPLKGGDMISFQAL